MDSTRRTPPPTSRSSGTIFLSRASTEPCIPRSRGTENPQMSASRIPMVSPRRARATARLTVTELLPTPPLPEAMAMTRAVSGMSVAGAGSRASRRARAMTDLRCSASITPVVTSTTRTPGRAPTWVSTSLRICVRSGHPATVRATSTATVPPPSIPTEVTIPSSTMSAPSSGSTTPRSAARTASVSGGPHGVVPSGPIPSGPIPSAGEGSDLLTGAIVPVDVGGPAGPLYRIRSAAGTIARDNHHPGRRHGLRVRAGAVRWGACRPSS